MFVSCMFWCYIRTPQFVLFLGFVWLKFRVKPGNTRAVGSLLLFFSLHGLCHAFWTFCCVDKFYHS